MHSQDVVLIVDDQPADHLLIARALKEGGSNCRVETVSDGKQALDYLTGVNGFKDRTRYPLPQVLLCDIKMPGLDGFEVLEWLQTSNDFQSLPVVMICSSEEVCDHQRAYKLRAGLVITKERFLRQPAQCVELIRKLAAG